MVNASIIHQFAAAIQSGNLDTIAQYLDSDGEYEIVDVESEDEDPRCEVGKAEFLFWIRDRWIDYQKQYGDDAILEVTYANCQSCYVGMPVVLFNDGTFPVKTTHPDHPRKLGYAVDSKDNKIVELTLCMDFA